MIWNRKRQRLEAELEDLRQVVRSLEEDPGRDDVEAMRSELSALQARRRQLEQDVDALRQIVDEFKGDPVIAFIHQIESRMPEGLGRLPSWVLFFVVGGTLGSMATLGVLAWQNVLLQQQATALELQNERASNARREELLRAIYELSDCDHASLAPGDDCPPKAVARVREEAIGVLAQIDSETLDLSNANLSGLKLSGLSLERVDFSGADLRNTVFINSVARSARFDRARLDGGSFLFSDLAKSTFYSTSMRCVDFTGVNLAYAYIGGADFRGATFTVTDASGVSISETPLAFRQKHGYLTQDLPNAEQMEGWCGRFEVNNSKSDRACRPLSGVVSVSPAEQSTYTETCLARADADGKAHQMALLWLGIFP